MVHWAVPGLMIQRFRKEPSLLQETFSGLWFITIISISWAVMITAPMKVIFTYAALGSNGSPTEPSTCPGGLASGNSIWCEAAGFTTARQGLQALTYNGYMYILGGQAAASTGGCTAAGSYCNDVQYDQINPNGSLGSTWTDNTTAATGAFTTARSNFGAMVYDGYLYITGGNDNGTYESDVQYAPVYSNGSIGIWNTTIAITTARVGLSALAYNGLFIHLRRSGCRQHGRLYGHWLLL